MATNKKFVSFTKTSFVRLNQVDNVITATRPLSNGISVENITTRAIIPRGHKIATKIISAGEPVRKYAQIIGYASSRIRPGDHVHTHNVEFRLKWTPKIGQSYKCEFC